MDLGVLRRWKWRLARAVRKRRLKKAGDENISDTTGAETTSGARIVDHENIVTTPYFLENFWGEDHNGFFVLYLNMKHGWVTTEELADYIRERAFIEKSYSRSISRLAKYVSNLSELGTFGPVWNVFKVSAEKVSVCHLELVQKLQELLKDVQKYADEQAKAHKKTKEELAPTQEIVQNFQNISQALQKSKEVYNSRTEELENMQRMGTVQKDIDAAEVKVKKATEVYKTNVEKFNTMKVEFEEKMTEAAQKFQGIEVVNVLHMKDIIQSFIRLIVETNQQIEEVQREFMNDIESTSVERLIEKLAESKGTGREKPDSTEFERYNANPATEGAKPKAFDTPEGLKDMDADAGGTPEEDPNAGSQMDQSNENLDRSRTQQPVQNDRQDNIALASTPALSDSASSVSSSAATEKQIQLKCTPPPAKPLDTAEAHFSHLPTLPHLSLRPPPSPASPLAFPEPSFSPLPPTLIPPQSAGDFSTNRPPVSTSNRTTDISSQSQWVTFDDDDLMPLHEPLNLQNRPLSAPSVQPGTHLSSQAMNPFIEQEETNDVNPSSPTITEPRKASTTKRTTGEKTAITKIGWSFRRSKVTNTSPPSTAPLALAERSSSSLSSSSASITSAAGGQGVLGKTAHL